MARARRRSAPDRRSRARSGRRMADRHSARTSYRTASHPFARKGPAAPTTPLLISRVMVILNYGSNSARPDEETREGAPMTAFDFAPLLAPGLPPPAVKGNGFPKYNFVGGHNDAEHVPVEHLTAAATAVLTREGATLATYGLNSGPLGYRPLREFLAA